ncbi:N-acetylmuramic acid 6-phosphate etherase [Phytoactinopolyspora alkaliphila]|uniref:N-acetylmuramic acid 6-phosphate etherase n=1 Tax=Phytoactinopolyspora alkaliphila TaxID=1783498 RepID=A0A6N9YG20_9ACTN|nr:N-acetylmuramic acid 6-phosphate etherase [Phytoactinopolyspora alkaliphila]NED93914.1 N-acetylmuramic acid 6-phosphate etherase [Phytoactinopolyspora alkaliphila]
MSVNVADDLVPTEARNPRTTDIDVLPTLDLLRRINAEDATVPSRVAAALPALAELVDAATQRFREGGSVHYFGAGSSGRLASLDVAELPPTYSADPARFVVHHAGGQAALTHAVEGAEDDVDAGAQAAAGLTRADVAVGVAASGRTPYVSGALGAARAAGAFTALISSNPRAELAARIDCHVCAATGPEAVAGSTRMKAGTAAKLLLNSFSTGLMIRLGKTYSNLMIDLSASNAKLRARTVAILAEATGQDRRVCARALSEADGELRTALVALIASVRPGQAREALRSAGADVRAAIAACMGGEDAGAPWADVQNQNG